MRNIQSTINVPDDNLFKNKFQTLLDKFKSMTKFEFMKFYCENF